MAVLFTSIAFYIGEKVLGLNNREYPLGELTAEILNISPEEYHELQRMLDKAMESMDCYEEKAPDAGLVRRQRGDDPSP